MVVVVMSTCTCPCIHVDGANVLALGLDALFFNILARVKMARFAVQVADTLGQGWWTRHSAHWPVWRNPFGPLCFLGVNNGN